MSQTDRKSQAPASATPLYIGAAAAILLLASGFWGSNLPATAVTPAASVAAVMAPAKSAEPAQMAKTAEPVAMAKAEPAAAATAAVAATTPAAATPAPQPTKVAVNAAPAPAPDVDVAEFYKPGTLPDNILGDAGAPVTIVEYASMSCPHCARFHKSVFPDLKTKYIDTGKARLIFREFPLNAPAQTVGMLARCVGPVRYFAFVGTMFERQDEWLTNDDFLGKVQGLSKQMGFTDESFQKCITDPALLKGINDSSERGTKFGVHSTPTFFVNGVLLKTEHEVTIQDLEAAMAPYIKG